MRLRNRRQFLQAGSAGLLGLLWTGRAWCQPAGQPAAGEPGLPPRAAADALDGPPVVSARAWAVAEGNTGRLLWGAREALELNMASTTKIMTAWVVLRLAEGRRGLLDETIVVSRRAAQTPGSSARIRAGDRYVVRDLLYGLLLPSGNDAAVALAEHCGPYCGEPTNAGAPADAFVMHMNRQAQLLRMGETYYFDPHGLGRNRTSARDLTKLARETMRHSGFRAYVRTRRHQHEVADARGERRTVAWNNTNRLLDIEGYDGIKTGTTTAAGACLVASGRRGSDHLFVVVLGCTSNDGRYVDTRNLFRWAWRERGHRQ
ncbi:MAG: serine hydrolase [Gemmataceae bacterium]|nr:serine hydrolase [Gemmataceae bacterium]